MARLLFMICLVLAVMALAAVAITAISRAAREGQAAVQEMGQGGGGQIMEKVSYAALLLLMLGVTSGLLGGL